MIFFDQKYFLVEKYFWSKKKSSKISMKKNPIKKYFRPTKKIDQKKSTTSFRIFFEEKMFDQKFLGYLFRSQNFPRFQKSHLENCAMRPGIQVPMISVMEQKVTFPPLIYQEIPYSYPAWRNPCIGGLVTLQISSVAHRDAEHRVGDLGSELR